MICYLVSVALGDACRLQEGQRKGHVQEERRCAGGPLYVRLISNMLEALAFVICLNGPRMFAYYSIFLLETHNSNNSYPIRTTWIYEMAAMSQDEVECWLSVCRRGHV